MSRGYIAQPTPAQIAQYGTGYVGVPTGGAPGDFLIQYSTNPIVLDGTSTNAETVVGRNVNRRWWVDGFRIEVTNATPAVSSVRRIVESPDGSNYIGYQGISGGVSHLYRVRAGGVSTNVTIPVGFHGAADRLYFEVDWQGQQIRFGKTAGGVDTPAPASPVALGLEWWFPGYDRTLTIGATSALTAAWNGEIYQPTGLRAVDMRVGSPLFTYNGQSNCTGATGDTPTDASLFNPFADCRFFHQIVVPYTRYQTVDLDNLGTTSNQALELKWGRLAFASEGSRVGIVKVGKGATFLSSNWLPTSQGGPGPELVAAFDYLIAAWGAMRRDEGVNVAAAGAVWWHGEADSGDLASANAYETNLRALIQEYRDVTGVPTLPFYIPRLRSTLGAYYATVQAAQDAVAAADPNVIVFDTSTWDPFDGVHYQSDAFANHAAPAINAAHYS